jgi:hypothetical protein
MSDPEEEAAANAPDALETPRSGRPATDRGCSALTAWIVVGGILLAVMGTFGAILEPEWAPRLQRLVERTRFAPDAWRAERSHRYRMAEDLIRSRRLIGMTSRQEVELLGKPDLIEYGVDAYGLGSTTPRHDHDQELLVVANGTDSRVEDVRIGFPTVFTARDWRLYPNHRGDMAEDIVRRRLLSGLTRAQVITLLGKGVPRSDEDRMTDAGTGDQYVEALDHPTKYLELTYGHDGRVSDVTVLTVSSRSD